MTDNINPSSGLLISNPTHMFEAERAEFQSDIVDAIKNSGSERKEVIWTYQDKTSYSPMPGIVKIRNMEEEGIVNYCSTLMRSVPNIIKLHIMLGAYPNKQEVNNTKTRMLSSRQQRYPRQIGEEIGHVMADKRSHIIEVVYEVTDSRSGMFNAVGKAFGVSEEDYYNNDLFTPAVKINFIKNT